MGVKDSILYNSKMYVHTVWANWRRVWVLIAVFVIALLIFSFYRESKERQSALEDSMTIPDRSPCNAKFGRTPTDNLEKIKSYNFSSAEKFLRTINLASLSPDSQSNVVPKQAGTSTVELPTIVTAASSNHFDESMIMLQKLNSGIRSKYKEVELFYFDLGLEAEEVIKVKQLCKCTVVRFPFEKFPPHVSHLKAYCWKPIIINILLETRTFVLWIDSSIAFTTPDLEKLFTKAKENGILMLYNPYPIAAHTHQDTFTFLNETPCLFRQFHEFHAACILINTNHYIVKNFIIRPWLKCALIEECMKTKHNENDWLTCHVHNQYHACHRFDQSVLSLLVLRSFHEFVLDHTIPSKYITWFEVPSL